MIGTLIGILVIALVAYVALWILGAMGLPDPPRKIAAVIIGIILLVALLGGYLPPSVAGWCAWPGRS